MKGDLNFPLYEEVSLHKHLEKLYGIDPWLSIGHLEVGILDVFWNELEGICQNTLAGAFPQSAPGGRERDNCNIVLCVQ